MVAEDDDDYVAAPTCSGDVTTEDEFVLERCVCEVKKLSVSPSSCVVAVRFDMVLPARSVLELVSGVPGSPGVATPPRVRTVDPP